ncbi:MAG: hypothetical protein ACOY30_02605 [Bacillota bacterium]
MKKRWVSVFLSALLPGAGQVYNGDYMKGAVLVFLAMLAFFLGGITPFTLAFGLFIWVFGIMDAYLRSSARRLI